MQVYIVTVLTFALFDGLWLGVITKSFYQKHLGYIFAEKFQLVPGILFYLLYAAGVTFFVIMPALETKSITTALYRGAFFGLVAYGAYDLTNQVTLAKWPVVITIADMAWGMVATGVVSAIVYMIITKVGA